jgi:hypothetical protein
MSTKCSNPEAEHPGYPCNHPDFEMVAVMVEHNVDELGEEGWSISPLWSGVDRPTVGGWRLAKRRQADKLVEALMAGVVLYNLEVRTDVYGQTYVSSRSRVHARTINVDLRRLGY